jgi:uncharacterized membrane protein YhiD involved in acid resistance
LTFDQRKVRRASRFFIGWASAFATIGVGLLIELSFLVSLIFGLIISAMYTFIFPIFMDRLRRWRLRRNTDRIVQKAKERGVW